MVPGPGSRPIVIGIWGIVQPAGPMFPMHRLIPESGIVAATTTYHTCHASAWEMACLFPALGNRLRLIDVARDQEFP